MYDLRNSDGTSLGHTIGTDDIMYAAHIALVEYGVGGTIGMLPVATHSNKEHILMALMADGRLIDSHIRLVDLS